MARFCGNCGTEVDETAMFCPTCGQPIDEVEAAEIPAAPAWPDPAATDLGPGTDAAPGAPEPRAPEAETRTPESYPAAEEPVADVEQWPPPEEAPARPMPTEPRPDTRARAPVEPRGDGPSGGLPQVDLPFTMPVTLSGWLIGIGAVLAVLGLIVILIGTALNAIDLLLLVGLLGVAATVFLSAQLPAVPHVRLITLVLSLVAFGVALDRVGVRGGGVGELLLFLGSAAAAIGAVILELGQDQPLGRSQP
jgi:hypothetical protein